MTDLPRGPQADDPRALPSRSDLERAALRPPDEERVLRRSELILPLGIGAALRLILVAAFLGIDMAGDEAAYIRLGWCWEEFGAYTGMWAPFYPKLTAWCYGIWGDGAGDAMRLLHIVLAVWTGFWVAVTADMFGGRRAALTAAWIFALYVPLAGFCAQLYSETLYLALFVPALYQLLRYAREGRIAAPWWRPVLAGSLVGLATLTRESGMVFIPPLALWVLFALRGRRTVKQAGRFRLTTWARGAGPLAYAPAAMFALSAALCVLPWTARNAHNYDRFVPVATSTGGSSYIGWNAYDINYDLVGLSESVTQAPGRLRARIRGDAPPPWEASRETNHADRASANLRSGLVYAAEHPVFFARSRVVEFIDLVSPLSFLVRAQRIAPVGEPLDSPLLARVTALSAVFSVPLLLLLALWGWAYARDAGPLRTLSAAIVLATIATAFVSGLSRYRVPAIPLLIVLAALYLAGQREKPPVLRATMASTVAVILVLAWIPSLGPTRLALSAIW
ncbi:MAG: glycosyltransferase family 39 protein [Planctomycetota bacterium]